MAASVPDGQKREVPDSEPQPGPGHRNCQPAVSLYPPCIGPSDPWGRTVLRQQVIDLILDIISATDPQSEVRLRLLRHLAAHPDCPEQALLCHLHENSRRPLVFRGVCD